MLDTWITALLKPDRAPELVRAELERLRDGGYLSADDVEQLLAECSAALSQGAQRARDAALPLLEAAGSTLREALDIPSRAEVRALTEALRAHQEGGGSGSGEDAQR